MASTEERINNAIVRLGYLTSGSREVSPGVRKAVELLGSEWLRWWGARPVSVVRLTDPEYVGKLKRWAEWYARAWALVPAAVRKGCPDPREIEPSWSASLADEAHVLTDAKTASAKLSKEIAEAAAKLPDTVRDGLTHLGLIVIAGLLAWGWANSRH